MNILNYLTGQEGSKSLPKGYCPNCWGEQAYEGRFHEAMRQGNIDLNNIDLKRGWIQAYAAKHFEGIELKPIHDMLHCPSCKETFEA